MKFEFNSIAEMLEMIATMGYVKAEAAPVDTPDWIKNARPPAELTARALAETPDPVEPLPISTIVAQVEAGNVQAAPAPQRKRRTKAEMEAARAAESAETGSEAPASTAPSNTVSANPFEASSEAAQIVQSAPAGQSATLTAIQATQAAIQSSPFEAIQVAAPVVAAPAEFIEARSLELLTAGEPLTVVGHMHKCRDFIAKHGQAKYMEGFALAGTSSAVGTYKPEQCARHQAALEFLESQA